MVTDVQDLYEKCAAGWATKPSGELSLALLNHLCVTPIDELEMLTFRSIGKILDKKVLDRNVLEAISLLLESQYHPLERKFRYINEDDEFELSDEDAQIYAESGELIHPDEGIAIQNVDNFIFPFFTVSDNFRALKSGTYD